MTEVLDVLADVPPTLAAAWAVWFGAGALLMLWYRKARLNVDQYQAAAPRTVTRAKSSPRAHARSAGSFSEPRSTASGPELSFDSMPAEPAPVPYGEPAAPAAPVVRATHGPRPKPAPVVVGDPFGDLATLLDQPGAAAPAPSHRTPSDSPILNSAGSPILRD